MATAVQTQYDVGGVLLQRPFQIRRLGHFGFNLQDLEAGIHFYRDLLGFRISDVQTNSIRRATPEQKAELDRLGLTVAGYFTRYGSDHHALVLADQRVRDILNPAGAGSGITINQITWQVGSLAEVVNSVSYFHERGVKFLRTGRDMPGSNWHTYVSDPDGHTNELYYGIEQIGWEGWSKPRAMYDRGFREPVTLPQISEHQEVQDALARGVDLHGGHRHVENLPATYDVDGILLPRPFKITRLGPVSLFVRDVAASSDFYQEQLGFKLTEEVGWRGRRCAFLRSNTEHHSLALYPIELREELGLSPHTTCMALGLQLANYRQLRDAAGFLKENGVRIAELPAELYPGIDYAACAFDPDGHCIQLYYYMEQVGWDGQPRPQSARRKVQPGVWPEALEPLSDTYEGEPFLGPWG